MATYFKYAERDADSQINWAEVGRGMSDMLAETNRVREEKKDALDKAQRETMKYLSETPNGEHVGARTSILNYADLASNRLRIADQLLKSGQMSPKDYVIFRQNITDNTDLAFNANKVFQEQYSNIMQRSKDGVSSVLEILNAEEVESFGNWSNIGWEIGPNGVVMAGKLEEQEIDGKKVRALNRNNPGALRSMDYLNQAILSKIDKYDYDTKINSFVDKLGTEKNTIVTLGKFQQQGLIKTISDIKGRKDIDPENQKILSSFIEAENDKIEEILGTPLDTARILFDSAKIAPNGKPYELTTNPKELEQGEHMVLKTVDPDSGGFKFELTDVQTQDAQEFIRNQMRARYDYEESAQVVGQVSKQEESDSARKARELRKSAENFGRQLGTAIKSGNSEDVANSIKYLAQKSERQVDRQGDKIVVRNLDGTGESVFDLNSDPDKIVAAMVSAFGTDLPEDVILKFANETLKGNRANTTTVATGIVVREGTVEQEINIPTSAITEGSNAATSALNSILEGTGFTAMTPDKVIGNTVVITAPNGKKFEYESKKGASLVKDIKKDIENFIKQNSKTGGGSTTLNATQRKGSN